ncbi:Uncharacterized RNA pseudouridine synthase YlyB [uncultured Sporomusa sp.]|uniref:Pseudouridine synthase n=1 Tax=uncultured Sporomusa sp. TaxID=307249 RepID=A0A212LPU9_9FIRM|nr:RluA family pseudouridine synthase [uncultured Sporomusa sp.]SCM79618.1 Uncharacterized RNA pseudouridine synthase YlyB [uncultured Sporomusa sp.]
MPDFTVPLTCSALPLKDFLRRQAGLSLTLWRKIKTNGTLAINGQPAAVSDTVYPGDTITVTWPETSSIIAENLPLSIIYEDEWLLAANKPAGMLVHPATGERSGTLGNAIMHYYSLQHYSCGFHPVNRLDRNTSGLILIAKRPDIQHWLNQNQQYIVKQYLAVATGIPTPACGVIDAPIGRKTDSIIEREVRPDGQHALTRYRVLENFKHASLLEVLLETGRTHQIRVHLQYIGCPLQGDDLYGGPVDQINRQALHAARLILPHPVTKQQLDLTSSLPDDLINLISKLGK